MTRLASCPVCQKPVVKEYAPFCSSRCSTLDLGRWLSDDYRVPAEQDPGDEILSPDPEKDEEIG